MLDVGNPEVADYLFARLDALVTEYRLDFLKWDHNRDLSDAASGGTGVAASHRQTAATYALLDRLRAAHPGLEIESCSSGGARVDLGILARTDRVWASDTVDAVERQPIQRWTSLLLPLELDRQPRRSAGRPHHRSSSRSRVPLPHRAVRPRRHRVGHRHRQ